VILLLLTLQSIPGVALTGTLQSPRVIESSGVAASRAATDLTGADRGFVRIDGARAVDWEDIALGPCPAWRGTCLYIADTGDNDRTRKSVVIYAVPEPDPPGKGKGPGRSAPGAALRIKYSGGPDDVEAIYVSPRDSAVYLVSKGRTGAVQLYRLPRNAWGADTVITVSPLQQLPISPFATLGRLVTSAAIRPDGRLVAIRTYTEIYTFVPGDGGRLTPSGWPACNITGLEVQGEAIDFLDDSTFVLTSEADRRGRGSIHTVRCPK